MGQLPGFSDMIDDPEKWRESMMQVRFAIVVVPLLLIEFADRSCLDCGEQAKEAMDAQRELLKRKNEQQGFSVPGDVDDLED